MQRQCPDEQYFIQPADLQLADPWQPVAGFDTVSSVKFQSNNGKLTGSINLTVCKLGSGPTNDNRPDAERDRILINFQANSAKRTPEENVFSGTFTIAGGTGRYAKLKGEGTIRGYFMCFDPKGCAEGNQGMFRDMQYVLEGTFNDPAFTK